MKIKVFTKIECPRCPDAKALAKELIAGGHPVEEWDVETRDGLAEATFYTVQATPSIIITDQDDEEIASWRGKAPSKEEIMQHIG